MRVRVMRIAHTEKEGRRERKNRAFHSSVIRTCGSVRLTTRGYNVKTCALLYGYDLQDLFE